jgi:arylsulfatase A
MNNYNFSKSFFFIVLFTISCNTSKKTIVNDKAISKHNIILIVADDLGRNDIACYGNTFIETPNLTAMAKEGIRFTNAYAAALQE